MHRVREHVQPAANIALGIESEGFSAACGRSRPLAGPRRLGMSDDPFVTHRSLLFTVAYEMLGSAADAEDVVQETWLRWADIGDAAQDEVRDPRAYLVRIVTRQASTGCARWPGSARSTSGSGCPSRC